ncbi:MAG: helix-hairpin-helix domain-containing protein [Ignavibacteriaceae bacterium]
MIDKKEIINLLESMANLMEFSGENRFKIIAFKNAANTIRRLEPDLAALINEKQLDRIKGIGKGIQSVIYDYAENGKSLEYEELKNSIPEGIPELFEIRGLGAKKIRTLYDEIGVSNIGELEYACRENRLALLKGFGEKTQSNILDQIEKRKIYSRFILISEADKRVKEIYHTLNKIKAIEKAEVSGELRRGMEIISKLEFILLVNKIAEFTEQLNSAFEFSKQNDVINLKTDWSIPVRLYLCNSAEDFIKKQFEITGSQEFIEKLPPLKLNKFSSEEEIFSHLKFPYIIPEMREVNWFEIKNQKIKKNSDLDENKFKGLLHFHTTYSDGRNTLRQMIDTAGDKKFLYAVVCDHSQSAFYANGLKEEDVLRQMAEVKKINEVNKIKVYQGIESDILPEGMLDYPDDFLENFDMVVASVHSGFSLSKDEMTARIIKAVENPLTDILAHPSGRLLLSRDPYEFDVKKVIDACAANDVSIEINSNPRRLDLDWRWIYYAREKGCTFAINPDAHSVEDIGYIKFGVKVARKGGMQSSEVVNYFEPEKFEKYLNRKVKRALQ